MINAIASAKPRSVVRARLQDLIDRKLSIAIRCLETYSPNTSWKFDRVDVEARRELRRQPTCDPLRLFTNVVRDAARHTRLRKIPDDDVQPIVEESLQDQRLVS